MAVDLIPGSARESYETNYLPPLSPFKHRRILDLGCGPGHFLHFLQAEGFTNYLGVDHDPIAVAACQAAGQPAVLAEAIAFLADSSEVYDVIVMNDLFEHFRKEDAATLAREAYEKLVDGGLLLIKTPNAFYPLSLGIRYGDLAHEHMYTRRALKDVLDETGFRNVRVQGFRLRTRSRLRGAVRSMMLKLWGLLVLILQGEAEPTDMNLFAVAWKV